MEGPEYTITAHEDLADETDTNELKRFIFKVDEINKRSIGKAIIKFCGNEGTQNDKNKATLRRLMQATISYTEKENSDVWKNAEVKMYDDNCDVYSILAGDGKTKFIASFDGLGTPRVIKSQNAGTMETHSNWQGCQLL